LVPGQGEAVMMHLGGAGKRWRRGMMGDAMVVVLWTREAGEWGGAMEGKQQQEGEQWASERRLG